MEMWHNYWFGSRTNFSSQFFDVTLITNFLLTRDAWAILPLSIVNELLAAGEYKLHQLKDPPPDRVVYLLKRNIELPTTAKTLINELMDHVSGIDGITVL